jgi:hypothetical protein
MLLYTARIKTDRSDWTGLFADFAADTFVCIIQYCDCIYVAVETGVLFRSKFVEKFWLLSKCARETGPRQGHAGKFL